MKVENTLKLLEKYTSCPECGNQFISNGSGTLVIKDTYFLKTCKCGWKVKVDENDNSLLEDDDIIGYLGFKAYAVVYGGGETDFWATTEKYDLSNEIEKCDYEDLESVTPVKIDWDIKTDDGTMKLSELLKQMVEISIKETGKTPTWCFPIASTQAL